MKKTIRILLWTSLVLLVAGLSTCHFGVKYEISQIPPDVRAGMEDTDWVGVEWIFRGMLIGGLSLLSLFSAAFLMLYRWWKSRVLT